MENSGVLGDLLIRIGETRAQTGAECLRTRALAAAYSMLHLHRQLLSNNWRGWRYLTMRISSLNSLSTCSR